MSWVQVGVAVGSLVVGGISANQQAGAAEDAANAQIQASQQATAEQARQFDLTRQDMAPWLQRGQWALGEQQDFLQGDYADAFKSPFYRASLEEGFKGLDAGAASRGNLWGGGTDADRIALGQNLASNQLQTYYNALAGLSNTGQTTAGQLGQFGSNYADAVGRNALNAGNARASSYNNQANAWGNFSNQLVGTANQFAGMYNNGAFNNVGWGGV